MAITEKFANVVVLMHAKNDFLRRCAVPRFLLGNVVRIRQRLAHCPSATDTRVRMTGVDSISGLDLADQKSFFRSADLSGSLAQSPSSRRRRRLRIVSFDDTPKTRQSVYHTLAYEVCLEGRSAVDIPQAFRIGSLCYRNLLPIDLLAVAQDLGDVTYHIEYAMPRDITWR
jgi:hypothetical protein